jgi:hypothetical protein
MGKNQPLCLFSNFALASQILFKSYVLLGTIPEGFIKQLSIRPVAIGHQHDIRTISCVCDLFHRIHQFRSDSTPAAHFIDHNIFNDHKGAAETEKHLACNPQCRPNDVAVLFGDKKKMAVILLRLRPGVTHFLDGIIIGNQLLIKLRQRFQVFLFGRLDDHRFYSSNVMKGWRAYRLVSPVPCRLTGR